MVITGIAVFVLILTLAAIIVVSRRQVKTLTKSIEEEVNVVYTGFRNALDVLIYKSTGKVGTN